MQNNQLIDLALWAAENPDKSVRHWPGLPRRIRPNRLRSLSKAVERARQLPEDHWPIQLERGRSEQRDPCTMKLLEQLQSRCAALAVELDLEPSIVATRAQLATIAESRPGNADEILACTNLMPWQAQLLEPVVERLIT